MKYIKLIICLGLLCGCYFLVISSSPPGGMAGEVMRHNFEENIDASPLFYAEVEHMRELEAGVIELTDNNH